MLLRLVRQNLAPYKGAVAAVVILQFLSTAATLYLPTLNAGIIDRGVVRADTGVILDIGGWMLAITAGQVLCAVTATYFAARVAMSVGRNIRDDLFTTVESFSSREVGVFGAPSLITRTTNDVQQVQMALLMTFTVMVSAPIMGVGGVVLALNQDVPLSGVLLLILPVLFAVIGLVLRRLIPLFRRAQKQIDRVNSVLREQIMGVAVIRAFVRERTEEARFDAANRDLTGTQLRTAQYMALLFPAAMLVANLASVAVVWFGAYRIDAGQMQIGALTAFLAYIMQILMAVMMSMFMIMMLPRAAVCAERICEVLDTESTVHDAEGAPPLVYDGGTLAFDDVGYTYPGAEAPVLSGISFTAESGQTTAIIGSTGAGKSTLLNLVPRLLDATSGGISIDGQDIEEVTLHSLRSGIGLVPQRAYLFAGTIGSNLRFGKPEATDAELWEALEIAQADDFVRAAEGALEHRVEQGGGNFSGGQRQRLAIARALVVQPSIYLFDDSFSALDFATDARLRAALKQRTRSSTVLIVAQRVNTITDAARIVVLEEGRVAGQGTHAELMAASPTYREIVESQLTAEEVQ
ncbi:ABC transporter ATP-binding protein [Arthrobacter sp. zg-Y820]|uniref:ABC transporter ATP-binding protein n=1 Tax=unclassified Arthrobacter TaxID=235627 RepID=UPI0025425C8B|nr:MULTISPECIES: ABC transporter ATP-binding protein [unclassified Arthrobacter]MCC9196600.1 ABC transporter ATP-binding protein/permease [Arthrobacter sp. zg-Y820]MDK1279462.1 ABC transporter ATP-binding protein [Arthrobacter sp. zg.Y820]MDK1358919.1 ABC transporter ATP-binding protein [Arthrobacter sp. zg-Y1219]WIB08159.1 ABC transporter ATP-binding protein [Arthrobacter sp. zg-Y820]